MPLQLPKPKSEYKVHDDERATRVASEAAESAAAARRRHIPSYKERTEQQRRQRRQNQGQQQKERVFVPRRKEDFGDGGAFPEIHVAQFPLDMGRKKKGNVGPPGSSALQLTSSVASSSGGLGGTTVSSSSGGGANASSTGASSTVLTPTVDPKTGEVKYDAVIKQGHSSDENVQTSSSDLVPRNSQLVDSDAIARPSEEEETKTAEETAEALSKIVGSKVAAARSVQIATESAKSSADKPEFVRYTPQSSKAGGAEERVVRMVRAAVDPLEPPKFKHTKVPRGRPDAPVPVLHSPPRKLSVKDQEDWNIPAPVQNWKNPRGFTLSIDKRLAYDGRDLLDVTPNDNFAKFSESLLVAEEETRRAVQTRAKVRQKVADRQVEMENESLRAAAADARAARKRGDRDETESVPYQGMSSSVSKNDADRNTEVHDVHPQEPSGSGSGSASAHAKNVGESKKTEEAGTVGSDMSSNRTDEYAPEKTNTNVSGKISSSTLTSAVPSDNSRTSMQEQNMAEVAANDSDQDEGEDETEGESDHAKRPVRSRNMQSAESSRYTMPNGDLEKNDRDVKENKRDRGLREDKDEDKEGGEEEGEDEVEDEDGEGESDRDRRKSKKKRRSRSPRRRSHRHHRHHDKSKGGRSRERDSKRRKRDDGKDKNKNGHDRSDKREREREREGTHESKREIDEHGREIKKANETAEERKARLERDRMRAERRREIERDLRLEAAGKKGKASREQERDVSERIALGMPLPKGSAANAQYDERLFNQAQGLSSGFEAPEDEDKTYTTSLFSEDAQRIYKPSTEEANPYGDAATQLKTLKSTDKFRPARDFEGVDRSAQRSGPVQFEKVEASTISTSEQSQTFGSKASEKKGGKGGGGASSKE